jgi:DNA invertase Pin-like site-specific DNA recombinase
MEATKYRAIKYIRLSSAGGNKQGESDSVQNQRRLIDEWLKSHPEIEIVDEKVDDGWSGLLFDRPAFKEMMEEIEAGRVNCCICKDLSRLGRDRIETGRYLRRIFPTFGVRFIAITDNIDTLTDSTDGLFVSVKSILNEYYLRDASRKVKSVFKSRGMDGKRLTFSPIYGYKLDPADKNKWLIDSESAAVIRRIFDMTIEGKGPSVIARILAEDKIEQSSYYLYTDGIVNLNYYDHSTPYAWSGNR